MIVTQKALAMLVIALALRNTSWGQQVLLNPELPAPALLTCQTIQLQSTEGTPLALAQLHLKVTQINMKRNAAAAIVTFKVYKKLKTDAGGKLQLPELKPDTYYLVVPQAKKITSGAFTIPDDAKPGNCTQIFILKDKGAMIHIEPAGPEKAESKK
jgi:hypothetical protein